jgi:aryl-alcohol dehydrogenase-like predicted oxidoreductase
LRRRPFGEDGPEVSVVGVGCSRLGGVFSTSGSSREEADLVRAAVDAGINFFDTSDLYSQGQSEVLLGKALGSRRSHVVVATKGGYVASGQRRLLARAKPLIRPVVQALRIKRPGAASGASGGPIPQDFSPSHLVSCVEASLRRLGTDYIDIYQLHSPPADVVDAGEFIPALDQLQADGKILRYGIAADHADDVVSFDRHASIASLQLPFSVVDQSASHVVLPKAAEAGVGVIGRSCFAAGLLLSALPEAELRQRTPDWPAIVSFRSRAAVFGRSQRELALQFNLGTEAIAVTIIGMSTVAHLQQVLRDAAAAPLTSDERAALTALDPA